MHFDFDSIIANAKRKNAFADYPRPLSEQGFFLDGKGKPTDYVATSIHYPGQLAYGNGPCLVEQFKVEIPQATIDAQHRSFKETIDCLIPQNAVNAFMQKYFARNFLQDSSFRQSLRDLELSKESNIAHLPNLPFVHTRDLEALEERKHYPRRPFSLAEYEITRQVCGQRPELAASIAAFHGAFMSYLEHLRSAIPGNERLDDKEKKRALEQIHQLITNSDVSLSNMTNNFLPAIALHYDRRVKQDYTKPLAETDFKQGMQWMLDLKVFDNQVKTQRDETRHFRCPARGVLMRCSTLNLGRDESTAPNYAQENYGLLMAGICEKIQSLMAANPKMGKEVCRTIASTCKAAAL